jgi:c-di-GMP-binding flagellar brake protein YcgR
MSDSNTTLSLIDTKEDLGQFYLETRTEVVQILRSLNMHADSLAVYFDQGRNFILTALLDVRPTQETFVFDLGSNDEMNNRLLQSEKLIFVGIQDGIRVQWSTGRAVKTQYGGSAAFVAWLPQTVLRLQRRDYFRVAIPLSMMARCHIPDTGSGKEGLAVHDISVGGLCVVANSELAKAQVLDKFERCTIVLGEQLGEIQESLEVRHVTPINLRGGKAQTRVGLRFANITPADQARIQRFLVKIEQAKRALVDE